MNGSDLDASPRWRASRYRRRGRPSLASS
jgi:hypothetical protein